MSDSQLTDHPIFDVPNANEIYYEVEQETIRRNLLVIRGSDVILAVGKSLRITSLIDTKGPGSSKASYKTLYASHVDFNITQMALSPEGKFLAVAGVHQLAIVILPRPTYSRLPTADVECRSLKVGEYYHTAHGTARIAQVYWHPWGRAGCSLLVMTSDGVLREYDVSSQAEEPLQTLYFLPQKSRRRGYQADRGAEQIVSFTFGKGVADWGPLTVYALARSGDIYAVAPFLPTHADVPYQYLTYLEAFVKAKRDVAVRTKGPEGSSSASTAAAYDQQFKYVSALTKQASATGSTPGKGSVAHIRRPESGILAANPARQGPFLLQPEPPEFEGSAFNDACDILYISYGFDAPMPDQGVSEDESTTIASRQEYLGVILVSHVDGRVNVLLDLAKMEAVWEGETTPSEENPPLPILSVFETIDLGIFTTVSHGQALNLLSDNYITLSVDPLRPQSVFAYHAFGVHILDLRIWMDLLSSAMYKANAIGKKAGMNLADALSQVPGTQVKWVLDTFSDEEKASAPVVAAVPINNPSVTYNLLAITSAYEPVPLDLLPSSDVAPPGNDGASQNPDIQALVSQRPPYVTLLSKERYDVPPMAEFARGITTSNPANKFMSTQTLLGFREHMNKADGKTQTLQKYVDGASKRMTLQEKELERQVDALNKAKARLATLQATGQDLLQGRLKRAADTQRDLSKRLDRLLQQCMNNSSAKLSEVEREWFNELAELNVKITANGAGHSLQERADAVIDRHNLLRKDLQELRSAEPQAKPPQTLGTVQLKSVHSRLSTE
ncbi:hypothetical protein M407DRAFT_20688 [Tulasnella calospora MUT 4182]|uniref:Uncharacterized protein n=1 Tax=Tulasnella calospora MUT 4182 TaxID=1051891 RepID=A0A0C3QPJ2_9AGAM|nr:hypothetical protein M407DRAFT_20688 [Tulasnella calospora MUT 4182]